MQSRGTRGTTDPLAGCRRVHRRFGDADLAAVAEHDARVILGKDPRYSGSRYRCCARKRAYGSRSAHRAARVLREAQGQDVHAYACPYCHRWHVGHEATVLSTDFGNLGEGA